MSRNLANTSCDRCGASSVRLDEAPRLITKIEAGYYFDEYRGMKVANATCPRCQARYLAWVSDLPRSGGWVDPDAIYFDLSYRSTFNDEPSVRDLPKPDILEELDERLKCVPLDDHDTTVTITRARSLLATCLGWMP